MFNLYNPAYPAYLEALEKYNLKPSTETQQKHQKSLEEHPDDLKPYKKEGKDDVSLMNFNGQPAVVGKKLGKGGFGVVKEAVVAPSGQRMVIKRVLFEPLVSITTTPREIAAARALIREDFFAEVDVLIRLNRCRGYGTRISRHGEKGYILTDLHAGKDLESFWDFHSFTLDQAFLILLGILSELRLLHDHKPSYLHNDLKPENVKIDLANPEEPAVKLMDFGASREEGQGSTTFSQGYTAPEIINRSTPRTFAAEIYSFGKVAWVVLQHTHTLQNQDQANRLRTIIDSCRSENPGTRPAMATLIKEINALSEPTPARTSEVVTPSVTASAVALPIILSGHAYQSDHDSNRNVVLASKSDVEQLDSGRKPTASVNKKGWCSIV
ncbi:MAG: protein kinase family protein [Gammaproteobacteria bacterium]